MNAILFTKEEFDDLLQRITSIDKKLDLALPHEGNSSNKWLSIPETCQLLGISKRTLQKYRDEGMISFTQVGNKIYFKQVDIEEFLSNFKVKSYNRKEGNSNG